MTNTYDWNLTPDEESAFIKIKEALHRHPELSLKEFQTTKLIQSVLSRMSGVRILDLPIETGVVASTVCRKRSRPMRGSSRKTKV